MKTTPTMQWEKKGTQAVTFGELEDFVRKVRIRVGPHNPVYVVVDHRMARLKDLRLIMGPDSFELFLMDENKSEENND